MAQVTALAAVQGPAVPTVTPDQLALIRQTIAKDATDTELALFLYDNARRGLHPLDRLLHFTKRAGKYTPVSSIDLMRSRAAATGEYAGSDDPTFAGEPKTETFAATVTVHRLVQGTRYPFTATARWAEYKPPDDFMWRKMPHTMLGKCAEALALRKGFPQELAGLYEASELERPDVLEASIDPGTGEMLDASGPGTITKAQRKRLFSIASKAGWTKVQIADVLHDRFKLDSTSAITKAQYDEVVATFSAQAPTPEPDAPF